MTMQRARSVLATLRQAGVAELCHCPGGRCAPLSLALAHSECPSWAFFDERSAAFFALGRIRNLDRPVGVVTTSGTAVGELLPAVMEAHYSGLPLVLVTADRPRSYRGTGAPQAAEQAGIFGAYADLALDVDVGETLDLTTWRRSGPLHVNVCFEEPLIDDAECLNAPRPACAAANRLEDPPPRQGSERRVAEWLAPAQHPLVLVGALHPRETDAVRRLLLALAAPFYAEALSGLREDPRLAPLRLTMGDHALSICRCHGWMVDAVLRIGGVPTHRLWRDLATKEREIRVCSVSSQPFSGLPGGDLVHTPLEHLTVSNAALPRFESDVVARCVDADGRTRAALARLCEDEPRSEPALVRSLGLAIPEGSRVFLGNSQPIRHWDLVAPHEDRKLTAFASRGLNGIDGQISTFLGLCRSGEESWGLFGDLTALYDLAGPWILARLPDVTAQIVVINNRGGRIFERIFPGRPELLNEHALSFKAVADLWRLGYERWETIPTRPSSSGSRIVEVRPDEESTRRFWQKYKGLR